MGRIQKEMISSALTVILAVLAIAVFIIFGGSALFYVIMLLAMIVGFYNAWLISKEGDGRRAKKKSRIR